MTKCLATVLVGDDPASHTYVRVKINRCRSIGLDSRRLDLADDITAEDAVRVVLDAYRVDPDGQWAAVIGRSTILGKPVGMLLLARDATVTYCHSKTTNLATAVGEADIVVAA